MKNTRSWKWLSSIKILAVLSSGQVLCISKSNKNNSNILMVCVYCYHDPTGKVFLPNFGWGQRMDRLSSGNSYFFFQQKSIKTTEFVLHHFDKWINNHLSSNHSISRARDGGIKSCIVTTPETFTHTQL